MPFPKILAQAQRQAIASRLVDVFDELDETLNSIRQIDSPHLVDLTAAELDEITRHVAVAKQHVFDARATAERNQP